MKKFIKTLIVLIGIIIISTGTPTYAKYLLSFNFPMPVEISIDTVSPTIQIIDINEDNIENNESAIEEMTVVYSDDLSGIDTAVYKYNSDEKEFEGKEGRILENGAKLTEYGWYEIIVTDRAGNQTIWYVYNAWAVARIEQVYYKKLELAIDDVPTTNEKTTIVMLKNVSEVNTIPDNKNVLLDIDKTTITGSFTINQGGVLEIEDGTVNNKEEVPTFTNNGTLVINSGEYISSKNKVVSNSNTLNIKGGSLSALASNTCIYSTGTTNILSGNFRNTGTGNVLQVFDGITNLEGGSFEGNNNSSIIYTNGGELNFKGVEISSDKDEKIIVIDSGTVNMSSGSLIQTGRHEGSRCLTQLGGVFNMTGGSIIGKTSSGNNCTFEGGIANLTGGIIEQSQTYQNTNISSNAAISVYGSEVTIDGTNIRNSTYGVCVFLYSGSIWLKNGTLSSENGTTVSYWGSGDVTMSGGEMVHNGDDRTVTLHGSSSGTFRMTGGTIKNSKGECAIIKGDGSGVDFIKTGGTIIGYTIGV